MEFAPVVLFTYNRPYHTRQTLEALATNDLADQSMLYIFSDGPKYGILENDLEKVQFVREIIHSQSWCKVVKIIEADYNKGLANSIVSGVSQVVSQHGRVIVLEDDIITQKGFLRYMNEALEMYAEDKQVMQISAYMYPAEIKTDQSTFFLRVLGCWGWGTWKRAWDNYSSDIDAQIREWGKDKHSISEFNPYFFEQLRRNANGKMYTWAVRWYASWMSAGGLSLFPKFSLVDNIGHDNSGENSGSSNIYTVDPVDSIHLEMVEINEDNEIKSAIDEYFSKPNFVWVKGTLTKAARLKELAINGLRIQKIREMVFRLLLKIFPELRPVAYPNLNWGMISTYVTETTISPLTKLYSPYRIHGSTIGDYTYISRNSFIFNTLIGKFCSIGPNFNCGWGIHTVDGVSTSPMFYSLGKQNGVSLCKYNKIQEQIPIKIGNDVFIGMNVTVLDGVTIGDGAVIGAGTLVSKDVSPYAIVVGNPMRTLRYRFPEDTVKKLQEIAWWNWSLDELQKVEEKFFKIDEFLSNNLHKQN
jgi:acetyltransferase-like isoleucine patch superfamily enzyme